MFKTSSYSIFFTLLVCSVLFSNCSKDFINDVRPTDSATPEEVFASSSTVRSYFNGIYRQMRNQWVSIDQSVGSTSNADTYGYVSVLLARGVKGTDIVMPYSNWYHFDYQHANREPVYRRVSFTWYFFYELINQTNTLIDGVQTSSTIPDEEKNALLAEARALRAFFYFELIREFQFNIMKDPGAPGIPIYTSPTTIENLEGKSRGTIQQVFDQINGDIEYALQHLGSARQGKDQVNINVAWGMAARIYLEQERWEEAADAAQNAIEGLRLDAEGYLDNYGGLVSPEVIWGFFQTTQTGGQSLYYGTPSSFFEMTGEGYDAFWISAEFASHFTDTDVRNTFYIYTDDPQSPDYLATNKFGTSTGEKIPLISGKDGDWKTIDFNESVNLMRVGEMYLIRAEALARLDNGNAASVLLDLQQNRDPQAVESGNTGADLIEEILLERRKELYGELGIDWLDAKRLQRSIDRSNSNHPQPFDFFIPANDPVFNLKIPQSEIQANSSLTSADQNP